jgi:predicted acetyltransferase
MNVGILPASLADKPVLRNLLELCQHDYSEYNHDDVDEHGLFGYKYLDQYWTEAERYPFLIRVDGRLAGFVLVRRVEEDPVTYSIAEFFVMRKYRRQGIGGQAARFIFDRFPGRWQIEQEADNLPAQNFWRHVIAEYTQENFTEQFLQNEEWHGPRQIFQSGMYGNMESIAVLT